MIWFLCAFSRSAQSIHVEKTWFRQNYPCNLLVIANGCEYFGKATHVINISNKAAVPALNAGLEYVRNNDPTGIFARMDDDDEYYDNYINEVNYSLINSIWSAIPVTKIKLNNSEIINFGSKTIIGGSGGTLAGKIQYSCNFKDCFPIEDSRWCLDMKNYKFSSRTSDNYIRIRHNGCYSKLTDEQFKMFNSFIDNESI